MLKKCKKYCPDKKVVVLSDKNVESYIEIPAFIRKKMEQGIIAKAHYSDYLRTCLLLKYGGTWIDATVLLTNKIPDVITESDFFVFKPITYSECKNVPSLKMLKLLQRIPTYLSNFLCLSNWFINSKSNNRILALTKIILEEYWNRENELIDYFIYHYIVTYLVLNDSECRNIFNNMPNISNRNPHLLQNVLRYKYDEDLYEELKNLSPIHKLTYKLKKKSKGNKNAYTFMNKITDMYK